MTEQNVSKILDALEIWIGTILTAHTEACLGRGTVEYQEGSYRQDVVSLTDAVWHPDALDARAVLERLLEGKS